MVDTILSDKTGTLTCNMMDFFKASIAGVSYGAGVTEIEKANARRQPFCPCAVSARLYAANHMLTWLLIPAQQCHCVCWAAALVCYQAHI